MLCFMMEFPFYGALSYLMTVFVSNNEPNNPFMETSFFFPPNLPKLFNVYFWLFINVKLKKIILYDLSIMQRNHFYMS